MYRKTMLQPNSAYHLFQFQRSTLGEGFFLAFENVYSGGRGDLTVFILHLVVNER